MPSCFEGGYGSRIVVSWGAVKASFFISDTIKIMKEAEFNGVIENICEGGVLIR